MNKNHYVILPQKWPKSKHKYDGLEVIKQRAQDQYKDLKDHYDWWARKRQNGCGKMEADKYREEDSNCDRISSESPPSLRSVSSIGNLVSRLPLPVYAGSPIPECIMRNLIGSEMSCDDRPSAPTPRGAQRSERPQGQNSAMSRIPTPSRKSRRHRMRKAKTENV